MLLHSPFTVVDTIVSRLLKVDGPIAVMAGHFSLVHHRQTGELVPGVVEDIADEATRHFVANHHYMGAFPAETWRAGIEVVRRLRSKDRDAKLLVLVNDWQHVESATSGQRNADRDVFFANPILPPTLRSKLTANELNDSDLITDVRDGKPCIFWCESRLRSRYHRHMKLKVPVESSCAQEWVPLIAKLDELGYGGFAAFIPGVCHVPIVGGTERANEYLDLTVKSIIVSPMGDAQNIWSDTLVDT